MWLGRSTLTVVALLAVLAGAGTTEAFVVTFDGLSAGTTYHNGDTFSNGMANVSVVDLPPAAPGSAQVVNSNLASGTANEMLLNGEGLSFNNPYLTGLSFQYFLPAATGNGVSLKVNGSTPVTGPNFTNQTFGSVQVFVTSFATGNGTLGAVFMTGPISSLTFGGNGLYVDNIIGSVPEPLTLSLLVLGGTLVARRKR